MTKKHVWKIDDCVKERSVKTIWYTCEHDPFTMVIRNVFAGINNDTDVRLEGKLEVRFAIRPATQTEHRSACIYISPDTGHGYIDLPD